MAQDNAIVVCKLIQDEWSALTRLMESAAGYFRRIYDRIKSMFTRLRNTVLRVIKSTLYELYKVLEQYLGFNAISNNLARNKFCQVLYKCKPLIKKLSHLLSEDFFTWAYSPDPWTWGVDLEHQPGFPKWFSAKVKIPNVTFTNKYEAFEYFACRLSLRGLLDTAANDLINTIVNWINTQVLVYLDLNTLLRRTRLGRMINALLRQYENVFKNHILPNMNQIAEYLDCGFALCDFGASSQNFLDDFCNRYKIKQENTPTEALKRRFTINYNELTKEMKSEMEATKREFDSLNAPSNKAIVKPAEALIKTSQESSNESLGETSEMRDNKIYDRDMRNNMFTPQLDIAFNTSNIRRTITISSPMSDREA